MKTVTIPVGEDDDMFVMVGTDERGVCVEMLDCCELMDMDAALSADEARALIAALQEALAAVEGATDGE